MPEFKPKRPQLVAACNEINGVLEEDEKISIKVGVKNEEIIQDLIDLAPELVEADGLSVETLTLVKNIGGELTFEIPSNGNGNGNKPEVAKKESKIVKTKPEPANYPVFDGKSRRERVEKALGFLVERDLPFTQRDLTNMLADAPGDQEIWHSGLALSAIRAAKSLRENTDGTFQIVPGITS